MNRRTTIWILVANLAALLALSFLYPHLMIAPGPLLKGHTELTTDCFTCHTPWRGSRSEKCAGCHEPEEIGRFDTQGRPIATPKKRVAFHQELRERDCVACHSEHQGVIPYRSLRSFSHELLGESVREKCSSCHDRPEDQLHHQLGENCGQCHNQEKWKPATFSHASLTPTELKQCEGCHQAPGDALHQRVTGGCDQCHSQQRWKPATFEHGNYFELDRDHQAECATCHPRNDYRQYTCYGCHEHSPANIRGEHWEEGIRNFENCVECHRSGNEHDIRYEGRVWGGGEHEERRGEGKRRRGGDDDD